MGKDVVPSALQAVVKAVEAFLRERFSTDLIGIVIAGSRLYGAPREDSDLDVVAVLRVPLRQRIVRRMCGVLVDVSALFFTEIQRSMYQAQAPGILECMAKGTLVLDTDAFTERLRHQAKAIYFDGPPKMPSAQLAVTRGRLTSDLRGLPDDDSPGSRLRCFEAVRRAAITSYHVRGVWMPSAKGLFDGLPPDQRETLRQALSAASYQTQREAAACFIHQVLDGAGGPLDEWESTQERVPVPRSVTLPDGSLQVHVGGSRR